MDINTALKAFVRTVERGSVTGAAQDLAISQPAVTKHLRNLERHVNARLLERTSRVVRPTSHGLALYERSRTALASIDAAFEEVRMNMGKVEGLLRLHAPSCIGAQHVHPIVMQFQAQHPDVTVDLILDNRSVDMVSENYDLVLTYGAPENQDFVCRRIGAVRRIVVAAPCYLERVGPIDSLERLSECDIITTVAASSSRDQISLCRDGSLHEVPIRTIIRTNNAQVLVHSLMQGHGAGPVQVVLASEEIADGRLVRVLPEYSLASTDMYLIYTSTRYMRPSVRAFIDFFVRELRKIDGIDQV